MNRKPIKKETEKQSEQTVSTCAAPTSGDCVAPAAAAGPALVKAIAFPVLLFFAMTVQTGTMSMLLCALAFLSLLGKKPLLRFRQRLCVPVLGLLAFAILYGAAAIYTPFGASGLKEFYKFLAAFSLAVILLARYDRRHVHGLLWGFAAVSSVVALVSLDMSCGRILFDPFNSLMGALGMDYTSALPAYASARVNGIYNDANVTACLFSLALFMALYLLQNSTCVWRRLAASLLAGVNAVSLLLTGSRGALLCFAAACLVWLLMERANRVGLFLLLVETAVAMVAAATPASSMVTRGDETAVALCLLSGVVLWALDVLAGRRLEPLLSAHKKAALTAVGVVAVICAAYGVAAMTVKGAYTFDSTGLVARRVELPAGTYTLAAPLDENVRVTLLGQTAYEKLRDQYETLYDSASGETEFTVPEGMVMTRWQLYAPEGTVIDSVGLSDGQLFQMGYPLLPAFIADRLLQGMGNSFTLRVEFDKDAWKIFSTAPLLGRGLGSTENLTRSVQSFQYESKYAHNHLLQTMSDTGLVGTVFALAFVLGSAWLCLQAVRKEKDSLAAALLAAWVMMNLHSLMEINFSVRGFKCFAYVLLVLPILLYAQPLIDGDTAKIRKKSKTASIILTAGYVLYLTAFGGLLESARMTDRKAEQFQTSDVYEYLDFLRGCVRGDMFDHDSYQRNYVANAVQLDDRAYNGDMLKYVEQLRASGTYENDSALARYYYLPRQEWDELFACSREGICQVRSSPDGWNLQMDFYRTEVLPAMGAENMDAFVDGVLTLGDALDAMNAEGRLEPVALNETNHAFLTLCRSVKEQGLSGTTAYTVLSTLTGSAAETGQG